MGKTASKFSFTRLKLGGLPEEYINPEVMQDFLGQAREFDIDDLDRLDQFTKIFSFLQYQYPWVVMRASELLKWVDSGMYEQLGRSLEPQSEQLEQQPEEWNFLSSW